MNAAADAIVNERHTVPDRIAHPKCARIPVRLPMRESSHRRRPNLLFTAYGPLAPEGNIGRELRLRR